MDNVTISTVWQATRGVRLMFYLVSPSEETYEHVKDVPNYTQEAIPCFLAMVVLEAIILYFKNNKFPRTNDSINSMTHGLLLLISQ